MSTQTTTKREIYIEPHKAENVENRNEFIGFMLFFYLIPVALMFFNVLPFGSHNIIIPLMGVLILAYVIEKGISFNDLGFNPRRRFKGFFATASATAVIFTFLILGSRLGMIPAAVKTEEISVLFAVYYVLFSAPIQEFIFRSVMHYEFELIGGKHGKEKLRIFLSALVFAIAHSFFHSWLVLVGTFALGLIWANLYSKYRNFWAIALSHGVLGIAAMLSGVL